MATQGESRLQRRIQEALARAFPGCSLTLKRLKFLLQYNPRTGSWTRREARNGNNAKIGTKVGTIRYGYRVIKVDYVAYYSGPLAYFYMTGKWPKHDIDHKNRNKLDDRWANLRPATRAQNNRNKSTRYNQSGLKGVSVVSRCCWAAAIMVNRKRIYLGTFPTAQAAHLAYVKAAQQHHKEFASW